MAAEMALGVGFEKAVQGARLAAGALGEAAGGAAGGGGQEDAGCRGAEGFEDAADERGLAGAGAAGDDQELRGERGADRVGLERCQRHAEGRLGKGQGGPDRDLAPGRGALRERGEPAGDRGLGGVELGQHEEGVAGLRVGNEPVLGQLLGDRGLDRIGLDAEQAADALDRGVAVEGGVALARGLAQGLADGGTEAERGGGGEADLEGDLVGGAKADAADLAGEAVGVGQHLLARLHAIGLEDARGPGRTDPVAVEEEEEVAVLALLLPDLGDADGELHAHARDLAQAVGLLLDHLAQLLAEPGHEAAGGDLAQALDPAGAEIGDQALLAGGRLELDRASAELAAPDAVLVPLALGTEQLAGLGRGQDADDDDQALVGGGEAEHGVAGVDAVVQHALDDADDRGSGCGGAAGLGQLGRSGCGQAAVSRAKPASRSRIRSAGSSRPTWMRRSGPSVRHGTAVRIASGWVGMSRLS